MKKTFLILVIIFIVQNSYCQKRELKQETVLDNISHLEDSVHYHIDSLPRLCDVLGMKKQYVNIGDCKLYCETEGEGIPLVIINGGPGGTHHYFHPWFSHAKDFCKVIYYDQRGCGQSDFNKGNGYSFRQAIDDLDRLRQKLGIEKWIVCGHSYGGALAQYYTAIYPEVVLGMVLIGSVTLFEDDKLNYSREYDYISKEEENRIDSIYNLFDDHKINDLQLLYNKDLNGDWKRQNYYKPTKEELIRGALYEWVNDEGFNQTMCNSYGSYDFKHVFDNCPIPTLLCEGKWDLTWKEEKAELFRNNHPNAKFVLFEKSGHNIFHDEPELFFLRIKEFVTSLNPVSQDEIYNWLKQTNKILAPQEKLFENEAYFFNLFDNGGLEKALAYYNQFKLKNKNEQLFTEKGMYKMGYSYLNKKEYENAIKLFIMNVESYPDSWNTYDILAKTYLVIGNKEKAIENYKKSIELNPNNEIGKKILKEIR